MEGLHVKTDSKGIAKVEDIEQGLYFIDPVDLSGYENMRPMLVSVPQWQEDELVYSVVVYPKHSPFEKLILEKGRSGDKTGNFRRD